MEAEARTEQQIIIREVTHIQPSWAERGRGEPGAFTLQLVLDYGTEEYILRPTVEDAEAIPPERKVNGWGTNPCSSKTLKNCTLPNTR